MSKVFSKSQLSDFESESFSRLIEGNFASIDGFLFPENTSSFFRDKIDMLVVVPSIMLYILKSSTNHLLTSGSLLSRRSSAAFGGTPATKAKVLLKKLEYFRGKSGFSPNTPYHCGRFLSLRSRRKPRPTLLVLLIFRFYIADSLISRAGAIKIITIDHLA